MHVYMEFFHPALPRSRLKMPRLQWHDRMEKFHVNTPARFTEMKSHWISHINTMKIAVWLTLPGCLTSIETQWTLHLGKVGWLTYPGWFTSYKQAVNGLFSCTAIWKRLYFTDIITALYCMSVSEQWKILFNTCFHIFT